MNKKPGDIRVKNVHNPELDADLVRNTCVQT